MMNMIENACLKMKKGVSLIELLIAMVIIGILVGFAGTYYHDMQTDAREKKARKDLEAIKNSLVAYIADENNINHERPERLSDLEFKAFRIPDPADSTSVKIVKRNFIEKVPRSPFGNLYWADLYYVYTQNPFSKKIYREPYTNPTSDTFVTGTLSNKFYQMIPPAPNAYCTVKTGEVTLATRDATNKNPNDAVILSSITPFKIIANNQKKAIIEFNFNFKQRQADEAVLNTMETRILESAMSGSYAPSATGMAFLFKNVPAVISEGQVYTKSGIGFKFSSSAWEFYDSPDGATLRKLMTGGWSDSVHSVKFVFFSSNMAECYLDGDSKGTAQLGAPGDFSDVYFVLSPDMFNMMSVPPPPYPPVPVLMDSEMNIHQIIISGADFSSYYDRKINAF